MHDRTLIERILERTFENESRRENFREHRANARNKNANQTGTNDLFRSFKLNAIRLIVFYRGWDD